MDTLTRSHRSWNMAQVRSRDTVPEVLVRRYLFSLGFRYRLGTRVDFVKPDIVLPAWDYCIFVHGCFWHRHDGCRMTTTPKSNEDYWREKFRTNRRRDRRNLRYLSECGWSTGVIWECAVRTGEFRAIDYDWLIRGSARRRHWEVHSCRYTRRRRIAASRHALTHIRP